jgi:hypothetical protein
MKSSLNLSMANSEENKISLSDKLKLNSDEIQTFDPIPGSLLRKASLLEYF